MSSLFWLTGAQTERLRPFFPRSHGKPCVDDHRVLSGIIFINRNGLQTLPLRMRAHCEGVQKVAEALIAHPHVKNVLLPGLSDDPGDLPPGRPSFIARVLGVDIGRFRVGQARRARTPQFAQAPCALLPGSGCQARNAA